MLAWQKITAETSIISNGIEMSDLSHRQSACRTQSPPCIEKLDIIITSVLIAAHTNGIHVDILKLAAS